MLSLKRVNSGQAGTYYSADDYYLQNDSAGVWFGEFGEKFGYTGKIKEADFQSLILGIDNRKEPRFQIQAGGEGHKHSAGVDLTFSAPKSVSVAGLVLGDKEIGEAHKDAVIKTLGYIEKNYTNFRVHDENGVHSEHTGNMLAAMFHHISSRELDPQLHTHCLVLNMTINDKGQIRAMDYKEIHEFKMLLGQIYRSELAANLKELGYEIKVDSKGLFKIHGIPKELINEFSKRTDQIITRFEELKEQFPNRDYAELRQQACLETRKSKDEPSIEELTARWNKEIAPFVTDYDKYLQDLKLEVSNTPVLTKEEIIVKSVQIASEHEAVASEEAILRVAAKLGMGSYRIDELKETLKELPGKEIVQLTEKNYTTFETVEIEQNIINQAILGKNQLNEMKATDVRGGVAEYEMANGFSLTQDQRNAVLHVLSSNDRVIAIQGDAGTGKTTMLDAVRTIAEKNDHREIVGLSFTGQAVGEMENASKINSSTIAKFLKQDNDLKGKLVVIDEASMLSIKDMNKILERCDDKTKIVLIGDTKQMQPIGQGKIFASLQQHNAVQSVRIAEIQRQTDSNYKEAVGKLGNKEVAAALFKLEKMGSIREVEHRDTRLAEIAAKYLEKPRETIIVTSRNVDREQLNQMIRDELRATGHLDKSVKQYVTREVKTLYGEEKFFSESYQKNDIVVASLAGVFGRAGAEARIVDVNHSKNTITVDDGNKKCELDLKEIGSSLQVYTQKSREFSDGDKILFLKNDKGLGVKNGQTGFIERIDESGTLQVKMDNGKDISFNPATQYKYITHGYALTDYKSQGKTEKHVIYHADTSKGVSFNQAYVGITRGKESVTIYTDDKKQLYRQVEREQNKTSTLDYDLTAARSAHEERLVTIQQRIPSIADDASINREKQLLEKISTSRGQGDRVEDVSKSIENKTDLPRHDKSKDMER